MSEVEHVPGAEQRQTPRAVQTAGELLLTVLVVEGKDRTRTTDAHNIQVSRHPTMHACMSAVINFYDGACIAGHVYQRHLHGCAHEKSTRFLFRQLASTVDQLLEKHSREMHAIAGKALTNRQVAPHSGRTRVCAGRHAQLHCSLPVLPPGALAGRTNDGCIVPIPTTFRACVLQAQ